MAPGHSPNDVGQFVGVENPVVCMLTQTVIAAAIDLLV
jgi:hypothetical protein